MNTLTSYRDDGPLATLIGRAAGRVTPVPAPVLTLLGAAVLAAALATSSAGLPRPLLGAGTAICVILVGISAGRTGRGRLDWGVPPMLRGLEYGGLLGFAILAGPDAVRACFVLLAVLAYHHYNTVYRLRQQNLSPPTWLRFSGGGWELRLLLAYVLLVVGHLAIAMLVAAVVFACMYGVETAVNWQRFRIATRPALYEDEEDEEE